MPCDYSPYTLPTIDFVAGETQDFAFYTYFYKSHQPFALSGCTANFSIVSFTNKTRTGTRRGNTMSASRQRQEAGVRAHKTTVFASCNTSTDTAPQSSTAAAQGRCPERSGAAAARIQERPYGSKGIRRE